MLALRVQVNDQKPVTGGASDLGVLTTTITAVGKLGPSSRPHREDEGTEVQVRLGGLTSRGAGVEDEHLVWFEDLELKPGDRVFVEVIETETPDPVLSGTAAQQREDDERAYYEHCKRAYFEMRGKYEGDA